MAEGTVIGSGDEAKALAQRLRSCLEEIIQLNGKVSNMLSTLSQTSKDKSYDTAKGIVDEVASIVKAGLPDCAETAGKLNAYGEFLISIQDG